jgi:membrane protein implicated in regulation of membrane protease activity
MTPEKKIAWLTVGTLCFGLWGGGFLFIFLYAFTQGVFFEAPDAIGVILTFIIFLLFVVLPLFAAWKFFNASRRLGKERQDKFVQKKAFE